MGNKFTKAFIVAALEHALVAGASAFAAQLAATSAPTIHDLAVAGIAAAIAAAYALAKTYGSVTTLKQIEAGKSPSSFYK